MGVAVICFFAYFATVLFVAAKGKSYLKNFLLCAFAYIFIGWLILVSGWFNKWANPYTLGFLLPLLLLLSIAFFLFIFFTKKQLATKKNTAIHLGIFLISVISLFMLYIFAGTRYGLNYAISITFALDVPLSNDMLKEYFEVDNIILEHSGFNYERLHSLYFFIGMCVQVHSILSFCFFMVHFMRKEIAAGLLLFVMWICSIEITYLLAIFDFMRP